MKKIIFIFAGLLLFIFFNCSDTVEVQDPVEKLTPYEVQIDINTLKQRRDNLIKKLPSGALVIITTNNVYLRNGDVDYDFRPNSLFYYLTGFEESNAVAIIRAKNPKKSESEMIMFVEEGSLYENQWLGGRYGTAGVIKYFNADTAYAYNMFVSKIPDYLNSQSYNSIYSNLAINETILKIFNSVNSSYKPIYNLDYLVNEMRVIKSEYEINLIQKSVDVSVQAFTEAFKRIETGMYEYEAGAIFKYILNLNGCRREAFPIIIASGKNITTIHYSTNNSIMPDGGLVMIDFGAEYGYYASDITRTIPINGKFSYEQKILYDIILEAQNKLIDNSRPGKTFGELSVMNRDFIIDLLIQRNIISGDKASIIASGQYRNYIPASFGHPVGLDVHDPFPRTDNPNQELRENMVFAYEPHVYLSLDDETVNINYRGICARIEDVILITKTGSKVLSNKLPSDPAAIELLMKQK